MARTTVFAMGPREIEVVEESVFHIYRVLCGVFSTDIPLLQPHGPKVEMHFGPSEAGVGVTVSFKHVVDHNHENAKPVKSGGLYIPLVEGMRATDLARIVLWKVVLLVLASGKVSDCVPHARYENEFSFALLTPR